MSLDPKAQAARVLHAWCVHEIRGDRPQEAMEKALAEADLIPREEVVRVVEEYLKRGCSQTQCPCLIDALRALAEETSDDRA